MELDAFRSLLHFSFWAGKERFATVPPSGNTERKGSLYKGFSFKPDKVPEPDKIPCPTLPII